MCHYFLDGNIQYISQPIIIQKTDTMIAIHTMKYLCTDLERELSVNVVQEAMGKRGGEL